MFKCDAAALFNEVDVKDTHLAIEAWTQEMGNFIQVKAKAIIVPNNEPPRGDVAPLSRREKSL